MSFLDIFAWLVLVVPSLRLPHVVQNVLLVSASLLIVAAMALANGYLGRGHFTVHSSAENVLSLQIFLIATSIPLMLLAALVEERRRAEDLLKQTESRMAFAAAATDAGLWQIPSRYLWRLIVVSLLMLYLPFCLPATAADPARILIINAWDDTMPAAVRATKAIRNRLAESSLKNAEIYYDTLDLNRFPGRAHEERMTRLLSEKYAETHPDIMIALGRVALEYLLRQRDTFAPGVPIIVCYWAGATPATVASLNNVTGVFSEFNWSQTFALAARLQPRAREVAIVSGASVPVWEQEAHRQLAPHLAPYKVRYLAGLPYDRLLDEVARLPRDTIVLTLPIFKDGDGVSRIPARVAADVARASSAPTYAPIDTFLGTGIVGGYMDTFEASGSATAELVIEVLGRKDGTVLPPPITAPHHFAVDARQLQRWGLSQNSLPAGTKLMFKEPTLWEQYRNLVLITVGVFALLVACLVALSLQVLKRRRAEATLEASEERMKFAAASTDTGLWQYDVPSRQLWATEHCRSMFGLNADSLLTPEAFLGAVHPDDRALALASIQPAAPTGETAERSEFRVVDPDGQLRWYLAAVSTEFDKSGDPVQVNGVFRDVTQRRKAEQEAEQMEEALRATRTELARLNRQTTIGAMAASIAHEINQPLSALVTNGGIGLRLLAMPDSDLDEVRDVLKRIIEDGHRAGHVITSIRAMFAKDQSEKVPVDIRDLIYEVLALVRGELDSQRVTLQVELHPKLPRVMADRIQLQQVFLNLIMNAIEAMGSMENRDGLLLLKSEFHQADNVLIAVEDSGPGIDPKDMGRIFDDFFTTKSHGMGLGLSICKSIIESHGGRLWASARMPHGSIFYVQLPSDASVGE
jgi:PAS domain S-box-containing protein